MFAKAWNKNYAELVVKYYIIILHNRFYSMQCIFRFSLPFFVLTKHFFIYFFGQNSNNLEINQISPAQSTWNLGPQRPGPAQSTWKFGPEWPGPFDKPEIYDPGNEKSNQPLSRVISIFSKSSLAHCKIFQFLCFKLFHHYCPPLRGPPRALLKTLLLWGRLNLRFKFLPSKISLPSLTVPLIHVEDFFASLVKRSFWKMKIFSASLVLSAGLAQKDDRGLPERYLYEKPICTLLDDCRGRKGEHSNF